MKSLILLIISFIPFCLFSQYGGESSFQFMDMTSSAKIAALGGENISLKDKDLSIAIINPSLLDSSYNNLFTAGWGGISIAKSGIGIGNFAYAKSFKKRMIAAGIHFVNYGSFDLIDENGNDLGYFLATEYMLTFSYAERLSKNLNFAVSAKPVMSYLESYSSYAFAADAGLCYNDTAHKLTVTALAKNIGLQIKPYVKGRKENIPFSLNLGVTKGLQHAPLRFSLLYHNIEKFDLSYDKLQSDKSDLLSESNEPKKKSEFGSNLLKHLTVGVELKFSEMIFIGAGFNFKKRYELRLANRGAAVGFSYGAGINTSRVNLIFGHTFDNIAGGSNFVSLQTGLEQFFYKKKHNDGNSY